MANVNNAILNLHPQASVLCGFHIPFQLVYEGVRLPSPPF